MVRPTPVRAFGLLVFVWSMGAIAAPQDSQTHQHHHYAKPDEPPPPGPAGELAPRLQNLGAHTFLVGTEVPRAQQFFDQGVRLSYGFNHAEAFRAFEEAARLDPHLAMAYWGQALVLGPNINMPMDPAEEPRAKQLIDRAVALAEHADERERAYIEALTHRYTGLADDRAAADLAYANAMGELQRRYPDDLDAATLHAEALMDLMPWSYWTRDGQPAPRTNELIAVLERVLATDPNHPGALHLWIHLWEATKSPERALAEADRLLPLMPAAGHLVHMPSHIYYRVGKYAEAADANRLAIAADEDYISQCKAQGIYPLGYYPHNIHFLWSAAMMLGQAEEAVAAADKTAAQIPAEALAEVPILQAFLAVPYGARVRFARWQELLELPQPAEHHPFLRGLWHHARGFALIRLGKLEAADRELAALRAIVASPTLDEIPATFSTNTPSRVLRIAPEVLAGELAAARGDFDLAIAHLHRGALYEDSLDYIEPPDWHQPVRHSLGAVLLAAGRAVEAEAVYWEDLRRYPHNGWALFGLAQAMRIQGRDDAAAEIDRRFERAWKQADTTLQSSRF
jgi:tetratricopeptide (TPR) repeat protein